MRIKNVFHCFFFHFSPQRSFVCFLSLISHSPRLIFCFIIYLQSTADVKVRIFPANASSHKSTEDCQVGRSSQIQLTDARLYQPFSLQSLTNHNHPSIIGGLFKHEFVKQWAWLPVCSLPHRTAPPPPAKMALTQSGVQCLALAPLKGKFVCRSSCTLLGKSSEGESNLVRVEPSVPSLSVLFTIWCNKWF